MLLKAIPYSLTESRIEQMIRGGEISEREEGDGVPTEELEGEWAIVRTRIVRGGRR
jgi:hypothetical protein